MYTNYLNCTVYEHADVFSTVGQILIKEKFGLIKLKDRV